ncbi:MAG TPA: hypothetical protein DCZ49_01390 [Hyphomonadaceae bacterium]|jgi:Predicted membrane protein|nr:hypothetical protein [Hyphomonadaceae bacterium]
MGPVLQSFSAAAPHFLSVFALTIGLFGAGAFAYVILTPHREIALVRAGNTAAGVSLAGAFVGLAIPLGACLAASFSSIEMLLWGVVTLLIQLLMFRIVDLFLNSLPKRIENDETGAAFFLVGVKIATAVILASAVSDPALRLLR